MRNEKLHAVVARSTCRSQNVQNTPCSDVLGALLEVEMSKNCTPLWREAHFQVKMSKAHHVRSTFAVARSTFPSQNVQNTTCSEHFWTFRRRFAWPAQKILHLVKSEQSVRVCSSFKIVGRRGTFEEDLQRCIFHGRRGTSRDVRADFLRGVAFWSIRSSVLRI